MLLKDWMRVEGLSDSDMAERIGNISAFMVQKLRFRVRGPSVRVAARIDAITRGAVRAPDLLPMKSSRTVREPEAAQ